MSSEIERITQLVTQNFNCMGGRSTPPVFARGVDVAEVVGFVLAQAKSLPADYSDRLYQECVDLGAEPASVAAWPDFKRNEFIAEFHRDLARFLHTVRRT